MPLVKKRLSVAAGATSDQVLAGSTYEYVDQGTQIIVAAASAIDAFSAITVTLSAIPIEKLLPFQPDVAIPPKPFISAYSTTKFVLSPTLKLNFSFLEIYKDISPPLFI